LFAEVPPMNKNTCPSRNELSGYANGTLPLAVADEVTLHIAACAACEDTLESIGQSGDSLLRQIQAKPAAERYVEEPACRQAVSYVEGHAPGAKSSSAGPASSASSSAGRAAPEKAKTMNRNEFVDFVTTTGLISGDELTATIKGRPATETVDAPALAKTLVQAEKLTKYQAAAIYQGKGKSLFYGDYLVLDRIGAGGMGQVFKARHRRMDRIVALKVMSAAAIKNADSVKRFEREVRAAAKLTHPNVVHAYDAGAQDDVRYLVMEYVEGCDLSALLKQQPKLGIKQICGFIEQAARGFAAAHAKGIVHRDVKPGNLLIDKTGVVKVLDMGLARFDDEGIGGAMTEGELTQSGSVMGTVDYMAPEQALDTRHADAKSDVYGLGCTLYRAVAGEPVYGGRTLVEKILAHRDQPIPSVRKARPDAPPALDVLLHRMMAKSPADRPTMQEVATTLSMIDPNAKAGPLEVPLVPTNSGGLPSPTSPSFSTQSLSLPTQQAYPQQPYAQPGPMPQAGGYGAVPNFNTGPAAAAQQAPRLRTAGAAPPRKRSNLPLLAAAGAGGLLILAGIWVYIKNKEGENIAVVQVPEGGTVEVLPTGPTGTPPAPVEPNATKPTIPAPPLTPNTPLSPDTPTSQFDTVYIDPDVERRVALLVLERGGKVNAGVLNGPHPLIEQPGQLPPPPFVVTNIDLNEKNFTDDDLEQFRGLSNLLNIMLVGTKVTDRGLQTLGSIPSLRAIFLARTGVTDAGLQALAELPVLIGLNVKETKVTAAGAEQLRAKSPGVRVFYEGGNTEIGPAVSTRPKRYVFRTGGSTGPDNTMASYASSLPSGTGEMVCAKLIARRDPVGLSPAASHFKGPKIDRDGANGFTIKAPADWRTAGTSWTFEYRCNQWDNGIQMIHPVGDGHVRMVLHTSFLGMAPGGPWGIDGIMKYYLPADKKLEPLASSVYPLNNTDTYRVKSSCDAAGNYRLTINDQLIVARRVQPVGPQQLKPPFEDPKCPDVIAIGDAALIIGPAASPGAGAVIFNEANDVRLATAGPALIAATPTAAPPVSAPFDPAFERQVAQTVIGRGGRVTVKTVSGSRSSPILKLDALPAEPFQLLEVNFYQTNGVFTDKDIASYDRLSAVESLNLSPSQITDAGIAVLGRIPTLKFVHLGSSNVEGPGLIHLVNLPNLTNLSFGDHSLNNKAVPVLAQFTNLEDLNLWGTKVSDISFVRSMPKLRALLFNGATITDFSPFAALPNLKDVDLRGSYVVDDDLKYFSGLKNLRGIHFGNTDVSDAGLVHLEGATTATQLNFSDTYVTEAGAARLRAKLPGCQITVKTKSGTRPSQRRTPPTPVVAVASLPSTPTTTPSTAAETPQRDNTLVCDKLAAKSPPVNLVAGGVAFDGIDGDGRRGANGIIVPAPTDWRSNGTRWSFDYRYSLNPNGLLMIHPFEGGHFRVLLERDKAGLGPGGTWDLVANYTYHFKKPFEMTPTPEGAALFPLKEETTYQITSRVDRAGNYQLLINDKIAFMGQVAATQPLAMRPPFTDSRCPTTLTVGHGAMIIGPRDQGLHEATQIRLASNARPTIRNTPPVIASTPSTTQATPSTSGATNSLTSTPASERAAATAVIAAGGKVRVEVGGRETSEIATVQGLPGDDFKVIEVSYYRVRNATDKDLLPLQRMPSLRRAQICDGQFTDEALVVLRDLKELAWLNVCDTLVRGPGFRYLADLPKLKSLYFGDKAGDDSAAPYLRRLTALETFECVRGQLSDISWAEPLENITSFHVGGSRVFDISPLRTKSKLKYLNLWRSFLVDRDLLHLRDLKELEGLNLVETDISDAGLVHLEGLTKLRQLELVDTYVTDAGLAKLRSLIPGCKINIRTKAGSPPAQKRMPPPPANLGASTVARATPPSGGLPSPSIAFLPSTTPAPSVAKERKPIPSTGDQATAQKLVRETFKDEYTAAKTPDQKTTLAAKLIDQARQTLDDPSSRYVLLGEARDLALEGAALEVLNDALNLTIDEFDVDAPTVRLDAWNALLKRPRVDAATMQQLAKIAGTMFDQATVDAEFDLGKRYGDFALSVTRRTPNSGPAVKLLTERNAALAARQKEWPALLAAVEKLKTSPDDAEANLQLARFHSLAGDDWPAAFPHYAKCGDPALQAAAEKSLAALAGTIQPAAAGDVWWDAAQALKAPQKHEFSAAADYWYRQAAPVLSGISRTRIQKRIDEMESQLPTRKIAATALAPSSANKPAEEIPGNDRVMPNRTFGDKSKDPPPSTPQSGTPATNSGSSTGTSAPRTNVAQPAAGDRVAALAYYLSLGANVSVREQGNLGPTNLKLGQPLPEKPYILETLQLSNLKAIGDAELKAISAVGDFNQVLANGTSVTGAGLAALRGTKIHNVNLSGNPQLTDEAASHLAAMPELVLAILNDARVSDQGIAQLRNCTQLKSLSLAGTPVSGACFTQFPADSQLESLNMANTPLNDATVSNLAHLKNLKSLHVERTQITDRGLQSIRGLDLTMIDISQTNVSDAGLGALASMKNLLVVWVGPNISDGAMQQLQAALPKCKVERKR